MVIVSAKFFFPWPIRLVWSDCAHCISILWSYQCEHQPTDIIIVIGLDVTKLLPLFNKPQTVDSVWTPFAIHCEPHNAATLRKKSDFMSFIKILRVSAEIRLAEWSVTVIHCVSVYETRNPDPKTPYTQIIKSDFNLPTKNCSFLFSTARTSYTPAQHIQLSEGHSFAFRLSFPCLRTAMCEAITAVRNTEHRSPWRTSIRMAEPVVGIIRRV